MPTTRIVTPDEGWNQNLQRQVAVFFDQHKHREYPEGRGYWCYVENPADPKHQKRAVGELIPIVADLVMEDGQVIKGWEAPWVPEQKYFAMAMSMIQGNRFKWNYVRMITDYREASERYYSRAARECAARNWPYVIKMYGEIPFQLRAIVGERPKSPKVPEAAMAEDAWLLGFEARDVNERLAAILNDERNQGGVTLEEAGIEEVLVKQSPAQQVAGQLTADEVAEFRLFRAQQMVDAAARAKQSGKRDLRRKRARGIPQTDATAA